MKRSIMYLALGFLALGCTNLELENEKSQRGQFPDEYLAYTDSETQTKVFVNSSLTTLWNADDRITIFNDTYNAQWKFNGETGADNGTFSKVQKEDEFYTGADIPTTYAVYPYNPSTSITTKGEITLTLPAVQHYAQNSYGLGANTMVAATKTPTSNALYFKSLCSFVVIKLYGSSSVKSITLTGNNGEKLAGTATVTPVYGEAPVATMSDAATTSITLDCGDGVALGSTAATATEFWFCIPPTTFSKGFTIKATNTDGYFMEKVTSKENVFERNTKYAMAAIEGVFDQEPEYVPFEDANFKAYCVENFDTNKDGEISIEEAETVTEMNFFTDNIHSIGGIKAFKNLLSLTARGSGAIFKSGRSSGGIGNIEGLSFQPEEYGIKTKGKLKSVNVSGMEGLREIDISANVLENLDVSGCSSLEKLKCGLNYLSVIDLTGNTALNYLSCEINQLTTLDVSKNTVLELLDCDNNQLTSLDVSKNTALTTLSCNINQITTLDVSKNTALEWLYCQLNRLTALDVSKNTALIALWCIDNQLTTLDVSKNTALEWLYCDSNQLTALDVSKNTALIALWCTYNQLTALDVSKNTALTELHCDSNQLTALDVSKNTALIALWCTYNQLTALDVSKNTALTRLKCEDNQISTIYVWEGFDPSKLSISKDSYASFVVKGNVPFEDANFKAYCVENFDKDGDGEINYWEAKLISSIWINPESVESISGIEYFTNLRTLTCRLNYMYCSFAEGSGHYHYYVENPDGSRKEIFSKLKHVDISKNDLLEHINFTGCGFTSLDVSKNTALTQLNCEGNQLTALDVSKNTVLTSLNCDGNKLATLDVSKNTALITLRCWNNQLTTLDVSKNTALTELHCYGNQLSALDVSKNTVLTSLDCSLNPIASLDVRNNVALTRLSCGPQLTALDVSNNTALTLLSCGSNQFTDLDVSKNTKLTYLSCPFSKLTSLDVTNNVALESLICGSNKLNGLDISKNTALKTLNCNNNNISTIYVWEGFDPSKLDIKKDDSASFVVKKAPVFEAVDLGLSVKWANWNLGAKSESDYGDFYAWGETSPKTSFTWANYSLCNGTNKTLKKYNKDSEYGTVDNKTRLESSDDAASVRLGGAWRIPTSQEWDELKNKCTWTWTTVSGVSGYLVTSNKSGYEDKSIFLPIGGGYDQYNIGKTTTNWGLYWTSDVYDLHYDWAYGFNFTSGTIGACAPGRSWGYVIRPVCQ